MTRVRIHSQYDDNCREGEGRKEDLWASVVTGGYTPPVFEPVEHDFNAIAPLVSTLVVFDRRLPFLSTWNTGAYPLVLQRFSEPVSVVAAIPEHTFDAWQPAERCPRADIIAHLPGGDELVDRSSLAVTDCVQLGVHATFGATDQAFTPPFVGEMIPQLNS